MSKFKVGDKVVCINSSESHQLIVGEEYTIQSVHDQFVDIEELRDVNWLEYRFELAPIVEETTEEHTGGSSSYYIIRIDTPTTQFALPYTAECNDIIEELNMTPAEANVFKATWRKAAARQGKKKKGNNAVYDAEKCVFFSNRMLIAAKREN